MDACPENVDPLPWISAEQAQELQRHNESATDKRTIQVFGYGKGFDYTKVLARLKQRENMVSVGQRRSTEFRLLRAYPWAWVGQSFEIHSGDSGGPWTVASTGNELSVPRDAAPPALAALTVSGTVVAKNETRVPTAVALLPYRRWIEDVMQHRAGHDYAMDECHPKAILGDARVNAMLRDDEAKLLSPPLESLQAAFFASMHDREIEPNPRCAPDGECQSYLCAHSDPDCVYDPAWCRGYWQAMNEGDWNRRPVHAQ